MNVSQKFFHSQKDKFTSFRSWGKGEAAGAKVVDELTRSTNIIDGNQVSEWFHKGRLRFRMTTFPIQQGQVFSQAEYEIL